MKKVKEEITFYPLTELAKILHLSKENSLKFITENGIKYSRAGRKWKFAKSDLDKFFNVKNAQIRKQFNAIKREKSLSINDFVSTDVVVELTGINISYIYQAIKNGALPSTKKGRHYTVKVGDVKSYLYNLTEKSPTESPNTIYKFISLVNTSKQENIAEETPQEEIPAKEENTSATEVVESANESVDGRFR